ncbi:MAG: amidohydrolase family protein [Proteobacteria bacterium]|nr:amidohydrolase family protein [Pseudomonadota bacterium]
MFYKCATHAPADSPRAGKTVSNGKTSLVVDIHCHRECAPAKDMMADESKKAGIGSLDYGNDISRKVNAAQLKAIAPKMQSLEERFADMDAMGVDIQAISIAPYQYYYWADPEIARAAHRVINDEMAEAVAAHPDRLVGLGCVPMQDADMATAELERCVKDLGMRGVEISTQIAGTELSADKYDKFFAKAEELDILIFIHPSGFTQPQRFQDHYFMNLIGHPLESTLGISQLIFGGVLERHSGLKIVVAHGGGYLPAYAGRMDHAYHAREDVSHGLPHPPTTYLKKLYFDTMVFEPDQLGFLIEKYGADHILLGTDYPYDMGEDDPVGLLNRVDGLSEHDCAAVCGLNAAALLGIET